ncbi:MAG: SpaH/EbpB family LPXTG-anchored major pilin [Ruminococcus sp.]|nr:SpaH/EbpB family LPXTG-anchored major pilin [Ruminococcus sp.]MBQ3936782.1 SpaH/EbpB family LPXTG-anchored major pilin [Ruminococcus sp.]
MKRTLRLFTAVIFTVFMVMSMSVTAIAAEGDFTITINKPDNDKADHTYDGYRIFAGTLAQDGSLTEVTWGAGIADGDNFIKDLKADTTVGSAFASATKASDVAKALEGNDNDGPFMQAFAKVVGANLGTKAFTAQESPITVAKANAGYYFIKDKDDSLTAPGYGAYSRFILKVVGNVELTAKEDVPTFDKNIIKGGEKVKNNTASVGDKVNYQIDSKVPDMTGYTKYFFVVEDEMTTGLTFNDDIKVTIGTDELDKDDDYTVTSTAHSFKLVLKNFKQYTPGADIKIEYSATLNTAAKITEGTNDNTANLTYSNNPNITPNSTTDEPGPGDVTGKTPDIKTVTGTSGIQIDKIDGGTSAALSGAKFKIENNDEDEGVKAVIVNGTVFKKSDAGKYYMLKNGSFTDEAPTDQTKKNYDSITTKYAEVTVDKPITSAEGINNIGYTKANGYLSFAGLDAGTYKITELEAPEGYNKLPDTIIVTLSAKYNTDENRFVWTCKVGNTTVDSQTGGCYHFQVANNKGATLPGTGGMGTTIFYVVGGLLIVCAGALLVTKIRMGKKEEE